MGTRHCTSARRAEQQLIALEHVQRAFVGEGADTDLGAREVLKDRDGRLVDDFQFADHLDEVDEGGTVAVGEIKAENPDASAISLERTSRLLDAGRWLPEFWFSSRNPFVPAFQSRRATGRPPSSGDDRNGPPFGAQIDALCVFPAVFVPCQVFWARQHEKGKEASP